MSSDSVISVAHNPYLNFKRSIFFFLFCGFSLVTVLAVTGITNNQDKFMFDNLKNFRNQASDLIIISITTVSDTVNLIIIGFILTIIKKTRRLGMILLISLIAITISVTYLKPLFKVQHPMYDFTPLVKFPEKFSLEKDSFMPFDQNYSYPSNHLASATAFSLIMSGLIFRRSPGFAKIFVIFFPALIGFTKLYLLQQHILDIVGGIFLGLIIAGIMLNLLRVNQDKVEEDRIEKDSD